MDSFHKFTILDIAIFELYLFSMGIVIAKLIPAVLSLNIWLYVAVTVVWLVIVVPSIYKKIPQRRWLIARNFVNLSIWKIGIYKLLVVVVAFLVLKLIPVMMTVAIAWYVAIAFFGMWYLMAAIYRKQ